MKITRRDLHYTTNGEPPKVGEELPTFEVQLADNSTTQSSNLLTGPTLISVVPNINTRVCSISTKRFNQAVDSYDGVNFYTISTNTTAEQKDWCAAEDVKKMQLLSDHAHDFGIALGLFIAETGLDSRSIWIVNETGTILYRELVNEMTDEPDYDAALAFLKNLD